MPPLLSQIKLACSINSLDHSSISTVLPEQVGLYKLVCMRFQNLFHSPNRGSFHLSLTVLCAIGVFVYLALRRGRRVFTQGFTCPVLLRKNPKSYFRFGYEVLTLYDAPFQASSPTKVICNSSLTEIRTGFSIPPISLFKRFR